MGQLGLNDKVWRDAPTIVGGPLSTAFVIAVAMVEDRSIFLGVGWGGVGWGGVAGKGMM